MKLAIIILSILLFLAIVAIIALLIIASSIGKMFGEVFDGFVTPWLKRWWW